MPKTPQELTQEIAKLIQIAHETGFNAGRQATVHYLNQLNENNAILNSTMSKEATEYFFERKLYESLNSIVQALSKETE